MHSYITAMKEHEFVLWVIGAKAKDRGKFVYDLPTNVVEVHEVFLDDALRLSGEHAKVIFTDEEVKALRELVNLSDPDWDVLFNLFHNKGVHPLSFLQSNEFIDLFTKICMEEYPYVAYADAFHTVRSMLLPVLYLMTGEVPKAQIYHAISTGYGGLLACLGGSINHAPVLLTEHGIYTREREEEILSAEWVAPAFRQRWIRFFAMLSQEIYRRAWRVTSLFGRARQTQIDMGAPASKCLVIPNGIQYERFCDIPLKPEDGWVDIGAVVRLAPIKDVKTLIHAFSELSNRVDNVRLHILGGVDDQDYADECYELVKQLEVKNLEFTGRVNVVEYMRKLDFTVLTSISEGQPLSVLESFAAARPCVTTDVGCCRELLEGEEGDDLGVLAVSGWWHVPRADQNLLVCMITYTLLASLVLTSFLSMPVTRFLADMLFEHHEETILPSFWGSTTLMLAVGAVLYAVFLLFSGATLMQGLLCLWLFLEMIVNWNAMSYLTAIKDYQGIMWSFVAAVVVAFLSACAMMALGLPQVESLLAAVAFGYGVMMVWDVVLLHRYFPQSSESPWTFLAWLDRFLPLALTGLLNRNAFDDDVEFIQATHDKPLTVMYIDLIGLHEINNHLGHARGDVVLCELADAARAYFGDDNIYRIGGDEFVIISFAHSMAQSARQMGYMRQELLDHGCELSVGMAESDDGEDIPDLVNQAENEMRKDKKRYYASGSGKRQLRTLNKQLEDILVRNKDMESLLQHLNTRYSIAYVVNLRADTQRPVVVPGYVQKMLDKHGGSFHEMLLDYCDKLVAPAYRDGFRMLFDYDYVRDRICREGAIRYAYVRNDGERFLITIFPDTHSVDEVMWVFAKEDTSSEE
jgi:diguanylate cyclase (GGDEF)-like protein